MRTEKCEDWWYDGSDVMPVTHECRLPKGHEGDHICGNQGDDQDWCRWENCDDDTPSESA